MASRTRLLARLGLILPAALAGMVAIAAHRTDALPARPEAAAPAAAPRPANLRTAAVPATVRPKPAAAPVPTPSATPAPAPYVVRRILDVPGVMRIGDSYWNESGAPAGPIVITVDLHANVLSVFRAGYEIGTAAILYGGDDKPTPLGVFPITQKDADHVSNLYDAPMPYMMRMTNDGISIHGSRMKAGLMTHGCVGIPTDFARRLFAVAKLGDKVIVTRGERLDLGKAITAA